MEYPPQCRKELNNTKKIPIETTNTKNLIFQEEESFVKNLVLKYTHSYKVIPYDKNLSADNDARPNIQTVNMFTTILRR